MDGFTVGHTLAHATGFADVPGLDLDSSGVSV
jgi:hypothetical protein